MYQRKLFLIHTFIFLFFYSCSVKPSNTVLIETRLGSIKIILYDDTPIHTANFIKIVKSGFYDSLLFHRVIKDFMIQGGDPYSKNAPPGVILGDSDIRYTLPPEIRPNHFHYRGTIAAARESDDVNPGRRSSGAQFYIVQGKKFSEEEILNLQTKLNQYNYQKFLALIEKQLTDSVSKNGLRLPLKTIRELALQRASSKFKPHLFSFIEKKTYEAIGGAPHLDGGYTIFGEVVEGLGVVERISLLPTDRNNRPLEDIQMKIKIIQ